jgi:hypothetical protein
LLFYARALNLCVLTAVCQLSSCHSNSTQHDFISAQRLLNYVSSHPDPTKPSTPRLWLSGPAPTPAICPDRSRAAASGSSEAFHATSPTHPRKATDKVRKPNSPLSVPPAFYSTLPMFLSPLFATTPPPRLLPAHTSGGCVCRRQTEAEYSAAICGAQVLAELSLTLANFG